MYSGIQVGMSYLLQVGINDSDRILPTWTVINLLEQMAWMPAKAFSVNKPIFPCVYFKARAFSILRYYLFSGYMFLNSFMALSPLQKNKQTDKLN